MSRMLEALIEQARRKVAKMSPDELAAMHRAQRESYVRAEMSWPAPKFKMVNGVKVYAGYEDYCNG